MLDVVDVEVLVIVVVVDVEFDEFFYYDDGFKKKKIVDVLWELLYNVLY